MEDLQLIRKIKKDNNQVFPVTFDLDEDFEKNLAFKIFNSLDERNIVESRKFVIRGNSFTIDILVKNINQVANLLINENIKIYGIYVLYEDF
ncbi:MAG: hypothetical protein Q4D88_00180 [Anaerococcus sp.]|nr:hypothetical protein [Anaerococcus sp.]